MIKEGGKAVKRGGERIWGVLEFLGEAGTQVLYMILRRTVTWRVVTTEADEALPILSWISSDSPLAHVGPVPEELRQDPFPGGSVPWSIEEAEKEQDRNRELMIWKVAIAVSWSVTAVALFRSLGML
jgi:hypothetical protein